MIVVLQFEPADEATFVPALELALTTLAARPGYLGGSGGRSTDDPNAWVLVTRWANVGHYRRALGNYDVKLHATPLLAQALDRASAFEELLDVDPAGNLTRHTSDRAEDPVIG
jgi:heme oxygenase (mycobilin-producing)